MNKQEIDKILSKHADWLMGRSEKFKTIHNKRYAITENGNLYSLVSNGYMRKNPFKIKPREYKGYLSVTLTDWGGSKGYFKIHRLVAEAFIKHGLGVDDTVHHINGDRSDNRVCNLKILDRCENSRLGALSKSNNVGDRTKKLMECLLI